MSDLLVHDMPDELTRKLAARAAENGRSQSAEVIAILKDALQPEAGRGVFEILRDMAEDLGGIELERPTWSSREFTFDHE